MQGGAGWGGATLPGSPPPATTPFGSQAMPSGPLGAPGLFHRAGAGREGGWKGGGALGRSRSSPQSSRGLGQEG